MTNHLARLDVSVMIRAMKGRRDVGERRATGMAQSCSIHSFELRAHVTIRFDHFLILQPPNDWSKEDVTDRSCPTTTLP
jgi:hypothetical protein